MTINYLIFNCNSGLGHYLLTLSYIYTQLINKKKIFKILIEFIPFNNQKIYTESDLFNSIFYIDDDNIITDSKKIKVLLLTTKHISNINFEEWLNNKYSENTILVLNTFFNDDAYNNIENMMCPFNFKEEYIKLTNKLYSPYLNKVALHIRHGNNEKIVDRNNKYFRLDIKIPKFPLLWDIQLLTYLEVWKSYKNDNLCLIFSDNSNIYEKFRNINGISLKKVINDKYHLEKFNKLNELFIDTVKDIYLLSVSKQIIYYRSAFPISSILFTKNKKKYKTIWDEYHSNIKKYGFYLKSYTN